MIVKVQLALEGGMANSPALAYNCDYSVQELIDVPSLPESVHLTLLAKSNRKSFFRATWVNGLLVIGAEVEEQGW